jgi:hypothetical protein
MSRAGEAEVEWPLDPRNKTYFPPRGEEEPAPIRTPVPDLPPPDDPNDV